VLGGAFDQSDTTDAEQCDACTRAAIATEAQIYAPPDNPHLAKSTATKRAAGRHPQRRCSSALLTDGTPGEHRLLCNEERRSKEQLLLIWMIVQPDQLQL
jgi:hypothetical protein